MHDCFVCSINGRCLAWSDQQFLSDPKTAKLRTDQTPRRPRQPLRRAVWCGLLVGLLSRGLLRLLKALSKLLIHQGKAAHAPSELCQSLIVYLTASHRVIPQIGLQRTWRVAYKQSLSPVQIHLEKLPPELWSTIASRLYSIDKACLALTSKLAQRHLGSCWTQIPPYERHEFLCRLDPVMPGHRLCFYCAKFHKRLPKTASLAAI